MTHGKYPLPLFYIYFFNFWNVAGNFPPRKSQLETQELWWNPDAWRGVVVEVVDLMKYVKSWWKRSAGWDFPDGLGLGLAGSFGYGDLTAGTCPHGELGRWCSFLNGWFIGSMLIFRGVWRFYGDIFRKKGWVGLTRFLGMKMIPKTQPSG